ncbi:sugar ABC transporter ATP-binding protein [uncultured Sulfitobacter sp.]|uniref:sugar ABC transporter ATP-binding protein n=1 Tax=uncultured Sulfitobacter sp. TaxID=191468 RepID=UPI0025999C2E|nr:sugar ABC transporter ATP-binding protein [uncultured Sulfitobacter sp.]
MTDLTGNTHKTVLEIRQITKSYGSTQALSEVNLRLKKGRVHAVMGENGAGKSTLIRLLVGAERPSSGEIVLEDKVVRFNSVSDAISAGIVPIYQHLTLFDQLTVLENLYSFETAAPGFKRAGTTKDDRKRAQQCLERVGLSIELDRAVASLTLGERQLLEIARGIQCKCTILLLDEPTAALNSEEAARLLTVIAELAKQGVAVVYISHKSDEIRTVADEITVLRDGKSVIEGVNLQDTSVEDLVHAMLGHEFSVSEKELPEIGAVTLEARDIRLAPGSAESSMQIRQGEIVGLVGLAGAGAEDFGEILAGARQPHGGMIFVDGQPCDTFSRQIAVSKGIGYVPTDRHKDGLFEQHTAVKNASASILRVLSNFGFVNAKKELATFESHFEDLNLSPNDPQREVQNFSGGNQQKILLARALGLSGLKILILTEPTRGVDVGARDKIHDAILGAANDGKAIVLITTDLEELTSLVHRTLIVRSRNIVNEMPGTCTPDEIAIAMQAKG